MPANVKSHRPSVGLARALSKLGYCSRSRGSALILEGRVRVNGRICSDPEAPCLIGKDRIQIDAETLQSAAKVYLMLNKPRGLVTSRSDEHGRDTVYQCFEGKNLPWISPVGRLDKASEGLILFTNDTLWADRILSPKSQLDKVYHIQIDCLADPDLCERLLHGIAASNGDFLSAKRATILRQGTRNSWLEIVIDEGKNRHIRRLLEACGVQVLRLVRIAIGRLALGEVPKGHFRHLTANETRDLGGVAGS